MNNPQVNDKAATKPADDSPWWLRFAARSIGTIASLLALALGAWTCVTITPACLLGGIILMLIGLFVALVESPCLCPFLDFAQVPGKFFDSRPFWNRALVYIVLAIIPIAMCPGLSTYFGAGLVFITGALYGVLAVGKKADNAEMRARASSMSNLIPDHLEIKVDTAAFKPST